MLAAAAGIDTIGLRCAQHRCRRTAQPLDLAVVILKNAEDAARCGRSLFGSVPDTGQEEFQPGLPLALRPHSVQQVVIGGPVLLEIEAQVEDWFAQHACGAQQKCDERPPQAAVAVEERVNRLELDVNQSTKAALTSNGRSARSSCRNRLRALMQSRTSSGGGGTQAAVPGRVPPIQFWLSRNSPGCLSLPRPFDRRIS